MKNGIESIDGINLSEIGKYNKFISFVRMPSEYDSMVLFPKNTPFHFKTNDLVKEKLTESERFLAMERMQECLDMRIEKEISQDVKLFNKIKEIQEKAKKRIEKLKEKPIKNLRKKYNYEIIEKYFNPKPSS